MTTAASGVPPTFKATVVAPIFSPLWVWEVPGCSRHQASLFWWQFVQLLAATQDDDRVRCGSCRGRVQMWHCPGQLKSSPFNSKLAVPSLPSCINCVYLLTLLCCKLSCFKLVIGTIGNGTKSQFCCCSNYAASIQ